MLINFIYNFSLIYYVDYTASKLLVKEKSLYKNFITRVREFLLYFAVIFDSILNFYEIIS